MIESSIEKVNAGTEIANNFAQALNEIVESITKAAELVEQITTASNDKLMLFHRLIKQLSKYLRLYRLILPLLKKVLLQARSYQARPKY